MLRTFLALTLDVAERDRIVELQGELGERLCALGPLRPTRPEQLHVAVAFLGDTDPAAVTQVAAVAEQIAERHGPFILHAERLRYLPKPSRTQVVALELADAGGSAAALALEMTSSLSALGWHFEPRRFLPHVTMFRSRKPFRCSPQLLAEPWPIPGEPVVKLSQVAYFASFLQATGARYELLSTAPLGTLTP